MPGAWVYRYYSSALKKDTTLFFFVLTVFFFPFANSEPFCAVKGVNEIAGIAGSTQQLLITIGTIVHCYGNSPTTGSELWRTDGTANRTVPVKDINRGAAASTALYSWQKTQYAS